VDVLIMKRYAFGLAMVAGLVLTGCETPQGTPNRAGTGAIMGAGVGAASGALIAGGHNAGEGALIGGAIGAVTGGLIGHSMDEQERTRLQAQAPQTYARIDEGQPLGLADIKAMASAGIGDDVIINQIRATHSAYHLSASDIIDLHNAGVSQGVLDYMINTANVAASAPPPTQTIVVNEAPPPPPMEMVVAAPAPGYVWISGEWVWNGRWVWAGGHWAPPPYSGAVWIRGAWVSTPHGWQRHPGYWR
jgi:outer membrane lipoprotein SlyB